MFNLKWKGERKMLNYDRNIVKAPTIKKQHRTTEILDKLGIIFNNKCFLCEERYFRPSSLQVEHFKPHKGNEALKYDWNNLYLACGDTCNQYKGSFENILDPCNLEHNVENFIIYELTFIDHIPHFFSADENNILIKNTCDLLEKIHNGDKQDSINKTASLRNAIDRRAKELLFAIKDYFKAIQTNKNIEKQRAEQKIKEIASRKSPYTMLMRSIAVQDGFEYLFD